MAQINLRVDDDIKKQVEAVCNEVGMTLTTAINIYLKKIARDKQIPPFLFMDKQEPFYTVRQDEKKMLLQEEDFIYQGGRQNGKRE